MNTDTDKRRTRLIGCTGAGSFVADTMSIYTMAPLLPHPLRFVLVALAGWMNQQQRDVINYLQDENRVLREQLRPKRLRFTDAQRAE